MTFLVKQNSNRRDDIFLFFLILFFVLFLLCCVYSTHADLSVFNELYVYEPSYKYLVDVCLRVFL